MKDETKKYLQEHSDDLMDRIDASKMKEQTRKYLQARSIDLMDKIDGLKMRDADSSLVSLVERVGAICSISVLNLDGISETELESVKQVIQFCDDMLKNEENIAKFFETLSEALNIIEDDFRTKKLLLDEQNTPSHKL